VATVTQLVNQMGKQYGENVVSLGVIPPLISGRIPTGFFGFDLQIGGGFPRGYGSIVYGMESSMKTTLVLKAIAQHQKIWPNQKCVFIDIEGHFDESWAILMGVDTTKLVYVLAEYAEQAVDISEAFLYADDIGLVVVDSLAAFCSANELKNSADVAVVGGAGLTIGKFYRKAGLALSHARRTGREPTIICVNQTRFKIGGHGDPETMSGGVAFRFFAKLIIRTKGKDIKDSSADSDKPAWKECDAIIKKYKVPITKRWL